VTRTTIRSFLREHLPDCRCPTPAPTYPRQVRAALGHLLRLPGGPLQRSGSAAPPTPVEAFLELYREHLRTVCGLADSTCSYRLRYARDFLRGRFGDGPMSWAALRPEDLMTFIAAYAAPAAPARPRWRPAPCGVSCDSSSSTAMARRPWSRPSPESRAGAWIASRARCPRTNSGGS
jgi:hypothetical protein